MWGLEKIADAFDQIHKDNMQWYRREMEEWVNNQYNPKAGDDQSWKFYGAAVTAGVGDALFDFTQSVAGGFADVTRLGDGVFKEQSAWGVAKDSLRVITLVSTGLKVFRVFGAARAIGGPMSCTISSSAKAMMLAGNGLRLSVLFSDLAQAFGGEANVVSPLFGGTASPLSALGQLFQMGAKLEPVAVGATDAAQALEAVNAAAAEGRGAVIFGVRWANGAGHTMVAFKGMLGQILYADQLGHVMETLSGVSEVFPEAARVLDSGIVQALRNGAMIQGLSQELFWIPGNRMKAIGGLIEKASGRIVIPKPPKPAPQPAARPAPVGGTQCIIYGDGQLKCVSTKQYRVQAGDNLGKIAGRFYGHAQEWMRIYNANKALLGANPDRPRLLPGQVLLIP